MKTEKQFDEFTKLVIRIDDCRLTRAEQLPASFQEGDSVVIKFEQAPGIFNQPFNGIALQLTIPVEITKTNINQNLIHTNVSVEHAEWIKNLFIANQCELKGFMLCPHFKTVVNVRISALPNIDVQPWGSSIANKLTGFPYSALSPHSQRLH